MEKQEVVALGKRTFQAAFVTMKATCEMEMNPIDRAFSRRPNSPNFRIHTD
jgi:hypothetical protein